MTTPRPLVLSMQQPNSRHSISEISEIPMADWELHKNNKHKSNEEEYGGEEDRKKIIIITFYFYTRVQLCSLVVV